MREICTSGSMSGERKRDEGIMPALPRLSSTLLKVTSTTSLFTPAGAALANSTIGHSADLNLHIARVGLNYRF